MDPTVIINATTLAQATGTSRITMRRGKTIESTNTPISTHADPKEPLSFSIAQHAELKSLFNSRFPNFWTNWQEPTHNAGTLNPHTLSRRQLPMNQAADSLKSALQSGTTEAVVKARIEYHAQVVQYNESLGVSYSDGNSSGAGTASLGSAALVFGSRRPIPTNLASAALAVAAITLWLARNPGNLRPTIPSEDILVILKSIDTASDPIRPGRRPPSPDPGKYAVAAAAYATLKLSGLLDENNPNYSPTSSRRTGAQVTPGNSYTTEEQQQWMKDGHGPDGPPRQLADGTQVGGTRRLRSSLRTSSGPRIYASGTGARPAPIGGRLGSTGSQDSDSAYANSNSVLFRSFNGKTGVMPVSQEENEIRAGRVEPTEVSAVNTMRKWLEGYSQTDPVFAKYAGRSQHHIRYVTKNSVLDKTGCDVAISDELAESLRPLGVSVQQIQVKSSNGGAIKHFQQTIDSFASGYSDGSKPVIMGSIDDSKIDALTILRGLSNFGYFDAGSVYIGVEASRSNRITKIAEGFVRTSKNDGYSVKYPQTLLDIRKSANNKGMGLSEESCHRLVTEIFKEMVKRSTTDPSNLDLNDQHRELFPILKQEIDNMLRKQNQK